MAMKQLVMSIHGLSDFRGIRKSSALIGAPSMINVGEGTLRTKALRLLLGPSGIGVILDLPRTFAELASTPSGVRQIAEAGSSGDEKGLAITGLALRRCRGGPSEAKNRPH